MENILMDKNTEKYRFAELKNKLIAEVQHGILPFWIKYGIDKEFGGFYGRVNNEGNAIPEAPKGLILNTRILWSFSAAYSFLGNGEYLKMADRAWNYLREYFIDTEFGGAYWMLDFQGIPVEDKKKVYGQAFLIYAMAEYNNATGNRTALDLAIEFFNIIEKKFFDRENGGYFETVQRDWSVTDDMRLSEIDLNEKKSMNAHLHILEAYMNLLRVWPDPFLKKQLKVLLEIFLNHIINSETGHFHLFFNEFWEVKSQLVSPGHDIEGSWLLWKAAEILDDTDLKNEIKNVAVRQAAAVYEEALNPDGSLIYEINPGGRNVMERPWWVQAEAMVGFLNAWQLSKDGKFYNAVLGVWNYISNNLLDTENGEWFNKRTEYGNIADESKISEWKGPYHNSRACLEVVRRWDQSVKKENL